MTLRHLILPLLLVVALIGAPFGMGRMMDTAHGSESHAAMAGMEHHSMDHGILDPGTMNHGKKADHSSAVLHFVMCSACMAVQPSMPNVHLAWFEIERPHMIAAAPWHGNRLPPLTPPPRSLFL